MVNTAAKGTYLTPSHGKQTIMAMAIHDQGLDDLEVTPATPRTTQSAAGMAGYT